MTLPTLRPGDIIACSGRGSAPLLVKIATLSRYSHVGIIVRIPIDGRPRIVILESTTLTPEPCLVQLKRVSGVQFHDPIRYAARYPGTVYQLRIRAPLTQSEIATLETYALKFALGSGYDLNGAIQARPLNFLRWPFFRWLSGIADLAAVDAELFCSELVTEALQIAGVWPHSLKPHRMTPASVVRTAIRLGTHFAPVNLTQQTRRWLSGQI